MTRSLQTVPCRRPSVLNSGADGHRLGPETSQGATPAGAEDHLLFCAGFLTTPQIASAALPTVADVAAARYCRPRLCASLDPVMPANGHRLSFEPFSGCGGVYARLHVLTPGLDGGDAGHGTTGVDVNNPLHEALPGVGTDDPLHLRFAPDELAVTHDSRDAAALTESGGEVGNTSEAGEATHPCVAYGLGARRQEDRLAAVDAPLVLAGRRQLDPARLGADPGEAVGGDAVKPQRPADSARTAAATGDNATIWEMLRHALPVPLALVADARPEAATVAARGLGEPMAVAADRAERCGSTGRSAAAERPASGGASAERPASGAGQRGPLALVPRLAETAVRRGSSLLVTEARRLRDAVAAGEMAA